MNVLNSLNSLPFSRVTRSLSPVLRWAVVVISILVILVNVTTLIIFATFDSDAAGFITGGDQKNFIVNWM